MLSEGSGLFTGKNENDRKASFNRRVCMLNVLGSLFCCRHVFAGDNSGVCFDVGS